MDNTIYEDCLNHYNAKDNKPFWGDLAKKYGFLSSDQLRSQFRRERMRREKSDGASVSGDVTLDDTEKTVYDEGDNFIHVISSSKRLLNKEDIISQFNIDLNVWEIERFITKTSEGYRKDRSVKWEVSHGVVTEGHVNDSGKMLVVPLYHIEVHFKKKVKEVSARDSIKSLIEDAKKFAPIYPQINYEHKNNNYLLEIDMPDIHFGRGTWAEESGETSTIQTLSRDVNTVLDKLLVYSDSFKIGKILLPIGNDFFNVDNPSNTTSHGTPQQESDRFQKTFRLGRELIVKMIDKCSLIAPVDVIIVPGNHDLNRIWFLGDSLDAWYHLNPNVKINNSASLRKYYAFGNCLIGFTHGSEEKLDRLPLIMASEVPNSWANTKFREFHTGDKHAKKDITYNTIEGTGVVVRILRSLAVADAWTISKGYVGNQRAGEAFLWHKDDGLIAQYTATPS